jgi:uncharacterized membrane protein
MTSGASGRLTAIPGRWVASVRSSTSRMTAWQWALVIVLAAYVLTMTRMSLDAHHGLRTGAYDLGLYEQGIWLLSRFETPFVTLRGVHLFGDHATLILLFVAPLFWVFPVTGTLLTVQSVAIAAGAIPVFLYARHRLEKEWMAFALAAVYLLHPTVSGKNMQDFHPDAFLAVFVGFALYGALMRKWRLYTVFVVLTLLVKEDVSLVVVPLGLWVALQRDRRIGLLTMAAGVAHTLVATLLILQHFSGYPTLYANLFPFGGPLGIIEATFTRPREVIEHLLSGRRPMYLIQMTAPFAWVFLRLPSVAAIGLVVAFKNIMTVEEFHHHVRVHHSLVLVAPLAMGTVYALGAIQRHRRELVGAVVVVALATSYLWGVLPLARNAGEIPFARRAFMPDPPDQEQVVAAREALALIPPDAAVAAEHALTAHLARRPEVYFLPNPFYVRNYGTINTPPAGTRLPSADDIEYVVTGGPALWRSVPEAVEAWERERGDFELVFTNDHYQVYRRIVPGS